MSIDDYLHIISSPNRLTRNIIKCEIIKQEKQEKDNNGV